MKLKEYITIQNNVDASTSTPLDNSRIDKSKPGIRFEVQKSCILPDTFHKKKKKKKTNDSERRVICHTRLVYIECLVILRSPSVEKTGKTLLIDKNFSKGGISQSRRSKKKKEKKKKHLKRRDACIFTIVIRVGRVRALKLFHYFTRLHYVIILFPFSSVFYFRFFIFSR